MPCTATKTVPSNSDQRRYLAVVWGAADWRIARADTQSKTPLAKSTSVFPAVVISGSLGWPNGGHSLAEPRTTN